jgi:hypothetical protein
MGNLIFSTKSIYYHILALVIFLLLLATPVFFYLRPSEAELLAKTPWCVDAIIYKKKLIGPKTLHAVFMVYSNGTRPCYENAAFQKNGELSLPGIDSRAIAGSWMIDKDGRIQINVDTLGKIFKGTYSFYLNDNTLVLRSAQTEIYAHNDKVMPPNLF